MSGVVKIWTVAFITSLAVTPIAAADLATPVEPPPPPPPSFYVHAGAVGVFFQPNAQPEGGGSFSATNIAIRPNYTWALEAGFFVTPNIAIALGAAVPGFPGAPTFGSDLLGSVRYGPPSCSFNTTLPNSVPFSPMPASALAMC